MLNPHLKTAVSASPLAVAALSVTAGPRPPSRLPFRPTAAIVAAGALLIACLTLTPTTAPADEEENAWTPLGLIATFVDDPLRNAVIDWHYRTDDHQPDFTFRARGSNDEWQAVEASSERFPFSTTRSFARVHLADLEPGAEYEFRFGEGSNTYWLRMLPESVAEPLVIAVGGDTMHNARDFAEVNRRAMAYEPDLVIWGGDLAYADGREDRRSRWYDWLNTKRDTLIDESGRVVPIVVCIGNHEVRGGYRGGSDSFEDSDDYRLEYAPYFYSMFAFPDQPGYGALDFANYLSLIVLDTDHSNPIVGKQTEWLAAALEQRADFPGWVIPVYHVPGYPSVRDYDGGVSARVRENWVPLFDRYRVRLAFENHDHVYKRTPPLRDHQPAAADEGTVYLGDGAWGVGVRATHDPETTDYLEVVNSVRHAIILKLDPEKIEVEVVSQAGDIIDRTTIER